MSDGGVTSAYGIGFVIAAYTVAWVVLVGYTSYVTARVRRAASALRQTAAEEGS